MSDRRSKVLHLGVVGDHPGGMAQVVNEIVSWDIPGFQQDAVATTRRRRDPASPFLTVRAVIRLAARSTRPELAVFHISERGSFIREGLLLILARMLHIKRVAHVHGADFENFAKTHPKLVRQILSAADVAIVLTTPTETIVRELAPAVRVHRIPNAVALPSHLGPKQPQIIFCGEVGRRKGVDVLLRAWADVVKVRPEWRLLLVGPLASDMEIVNLPRSTTLLPSMPRADVLEYQLISSIAILPSRAEALPLFLIEAMARGCVPISTSVGQIEELIGVHGFVVPPGSEAELKAALLDATSDLSRLQNLSRTATNHIEANYSARAVIPQVQHAWTDALTLTEPS